MKRSLLPLSIIMIVMIASNIEAATYTYDDLNRLVKVEYESGTSIEYQYDLAGNIVRVINISTSLETDSDEKNDENKENEREEIKEEEEKEGDNECNEFNDDRVNESNQGTYQEVIVKKNNAIKEDKKNNMRIVLQLNSKELIVNNKRVKMDTQMFVSSKNRLMVPIRYVSYAIGMSEKDITWNSIDKTVVIKGEKEVKIGLNQEYMRVDGAKVHLNEEMTLVNGRTFLPIADICKAFGLQYSWDNGLKRLTIY